MAANFERMRQNFLRQFEPDGQDFFYRRYSRGPAYRVRAAEWDAFLSDYDHAQRIGRWLLIGGLLVMVAVAVGVAVALDVDVNNGWWAGGTTVATIALIALSVVRSLRSYTAPARALETRIPAAPALTRDQQRHQALGGLTWKNLGTAAAIMIILPFGMTDGHPLIGWNRLWLAISASGLLFVAIQALRKWRFDHQG